MAYPLFLRSLFIAAVALLILVPIALIDGKINERRNRADTVAAQFARETVGPQVIAGPFLVTACERTFNQGLTAPCGTQLHAPKTLDVVGTLDPELRKRGIYVIRAYRAGLEFSGDFTWPADPSPDGGAGTAKWKHAYLVMHVSDPRGIKEITLPTNSEIDPRFVVRHDLGPAGDRKAGTTVPFKFKLSLAGASSLAIAPAGDTTQIRLASAWRHPSFTGAWSPDQRNISAAGFEAAWRTTGLATGGQSRWRKHVDDGSLFKGDAFAAGVSLFDPVNVYALSYRATEYGFLFVLFTFSALALAEVLAGVKLHPVQYLLVGSALAVFFLLLIAISEHIAFILAYGTAAGSCILLLMAYLWHALERWTRRLAFLVLFTSLYGTLYVILNAEDHAMLMGSLMVFAVLAFAMISTRKLDWSQLSRQLTAPAATSTAPAPSASHLA